MKQNKNLKKKLKQSIVLLMSLAMIATTAGSVFASEEVIENGEVTGIEEIVEDTKDIEDTEDTIDVVEDTTTITEEISEDATEVEEDISEETEHTFGDWTVTKEATYTETGLQERTCTSCGYVETEEIAKIAHEHVAGTLTTTKTEHSWTCKLCGEVYDQGEHEFSEWEYENETSNGSTKVMIGTCKCGQKETKTVSVGTVITAVDVTITEPVIGEHPDFNPVITTTPATDDVKLAYVYWHKYDPDNTNYCLGILKETDVFEEGYVYKVDVQYNTYQTATIFNGQSGTVFTFNGETPETNPFHTWERISYSVSFAKLEAHEHEYVYESTKDGHYQICECGDETELEEHTFGSWKNAGRGKQSHTCTVCGYTETKSNSTIIMDSIYDLFKNIFGFGSRSSNTNTNFLNNIFGSSIFSNNSMGRNNRMR